MCERERPPASSLLAMAAATPPSPLDWTWPASRPPTLTTSSSPLELQLLPPTPFTTASESPWGLDPSRLQQLMMGSVDSPPPLSTPLAAACNSSSRDLGALFDDNSAGKPLPSGWERCLDLQSGKMFLKKCEVVAKESQNSGNPCMEQSVDWKQRGVETGNWPEAFSKPDQQRQDWSGGWKGEMILMSQHEPLHGKKSFVSASTRLHQDTEGLSMLDREPLCLDLELKLTNQRSSSNIRFEAKEVTSLRPFDSTVPRPASNQSCVQESIQLWKWQDCANGSDKSASIHEMTKESTMVTAVCSKCLMYVLLRKSNPICPRCSASIIVDGAAALGSSVSRKRPRLDFSPDMLSLSTDSSR